MSGKVLDLMKKKPVPKVFSSIGVKPSAKKNVVINAKIIDRTGDNIVDRTAILRNLKKNTDATPPPVPVPASTPMPPIPPSSDTSMTPVVEPQELPKPPKTTQRSKPKKLKIITPIIDDAAGDAAGDVAFVTDNAGETPAPAASTTTVKVKKNPKKLPKKLVIKDTITGVTLKPKSDLETLEELPPSLIVIEDVPIAKRLPKPEILPLGRI